MADRKSDRSPLAEELLGQLRAVTAGEFEVVREIGHGGMARVYLAHELALDRPVALKVLSPLFSEYPEIVRRFQHEARTAGQLSHPNIVPVFAVYQRGGLSFFSMPHISGASLRARLHKTGPLELEEVLRYLRQAAAGLAYAHEHDVVHRDVKPENMMLEGGGRRLMLTDFGLAKALGGESLTLPGDMIGTPHYMSPEQCEGRSELDGRSDQYALGLVAYEMLAGEHPFGDLGFRALMMKQLSEDPPSLAEQRPDLPGRVVRAVERALAKEPAARFPDMAGFGRELAVTGAPVRVSPPSARSGDGNGTADPDAKTLWMRDQLQRTHRRQALRPWSVAAGFVLAASLATYTGHSVLRTDPADAAGAISPRGSQEAATLAYRELGPRPPGAEFVGPPGPSVGAAGPAVEERREAARPTNDRDAVGTGGAATVQPEPNKEGTGVRNATGGAAEGRQGTERADPAAKTGPHTGERRLAASETVAETGGARPAGEVAGGPDVDGKRVEGPRGEPDPPTETTEDVAKLRPPTDGGRSETTASGAADDGIGAGRDPSGTAAGSDEVEEISTGEEAGARLDPEEAVADTEVDPAVELADVIEQYRIAMENEDLEGLRADVYGGDMPSADAHTLEEIFKRVESLQLDLGVPPLETSGDQAVLDVEHRMDFVLSRTKRRQTPRLRFRMTFERAADGWRLARLQQR